VKLKCEDGVIRDFQIAHGDGDFLPDGSRHNGYSDAFCRLCGYEFRCADTKFLKPKFKKHICEKKQGD